MRTAISVVAALVLCVGTVRPQSAGRALTVQRIWGNYEFSGEPLPEMHWLPGGTAWVEARPTPSGGNDLVRVDAATGRSAILVPATSLVGDDGKPIVIEGFSLSADGTKALLFHDSQRVWRLNTKGTYHVVDLATRRLVPVSHAAGLQMFATFSPDGRMVAFVRDNNLYVTELATQREWALTTDGSAVVLNGTTDWVYEEELDLRDAFRWSPDSKRIAFWRFDQSAIPQYPLLDDRTLYPTIVPVRYPKAGEPNSVVRIGVVTVSTGAMTWIDIGSDTSAATGGYVARVEWAGDDSLTLQRLPRRQDRIDLLMRSATTGRGRTVLTERADSAWVDVADGAPRWVNGGTMFLWPSERSGWQQYYLFRRDGSLVRRVTNDGVDVTDLVGVDDQRGLAYVTEAGPTPAQRQLWAYDISRSNAGTQVTREPGTHDVQIAPGAGYLVDSYSTAATPPLVTLRSLAPAAPPRVLARDTALEANLGALHVRPPQFFTIPMPDGTRLDALRIVPPAFDSTRRYPVLMYVYGGPGSQTVLDAFGGAEYAWYQMLAQRGFVIVTVDNRGTGGRGSAFRRAVYLHLGLRESQDQIDAARWLAAQPWVDATHIGIWGWSYGGYMSSLTAFRGGTLFRAAISVAPVTDWRLYDDIYTERYMRTPADNPDGYHVSAPQRYVDGLTARYLLVFGSGDDNVHPQNSIQLASRLIGAGKLFEMMVYPNRTHAIAGGNTRQQLYETLTRFIDEQLGEPRDAAGAPAAAGGVRQ